MQIRTQGIVIVLLHYQKATGTGPPGYFFLTQKSRPTLEGSNCTSKFLVPAFRKKNARTEGVGDKEYSPGLRWSIKILTHADLSNKTKKHDLCCTQPSLCFLSKMTFSCHCGFLCPSTWKMQQVRHKSTRRDGHAGCPHGKCAKLNTKTPLGTDIVVFPLMGLKKYKAFGCLVLLLLLKIQGVCCVILCAFRWRFLCTEAQGNGRPLPHSGQQNPRRRSISEFKSCAFIRGDP